MNHNHPSSRLRQMHGLLLVGMVLSLASIGCSSQTSLTVTSVDRQQTFRQGFTQAYSSRNGNGDIDVVLIDQATEKGLSGRVSDSPVSQVMHIRLLWSPTRDMKAVTSNASVKWYVIGRSIPPGLLEYDGIAFVSSTDDNDATILKIRNSTLTLSAKHGAMIDWIGTSRVEGTIAARDNPRIVEKVLGQLNATVAAAGNPPTGVSSIAP
ncbi:MAG TPA: hypothetical protein VG326_08895 [Tepidisphaeraceae bacterium]|nr:hypothetical protein [Tepidisphaeraceae bacterium]